MRMRSMLAVLAPTRITVIGTAAVLFAHWLVAYLGGRLFGSLIVPTVTEQIVKLMPRVMAKMTTKVMRDAADLGIGLWMLMFTEWFVTALNAMAAYVVVCLIVHAAVAHHAKSTVGR